MKHEFYIQVFILIMGHTYISQLLHFVFQAILVLVRSTNIFAGCFKAITVCGEMVVYLEKGLTAGKIISNIVSDNSSIYL